MSARQSHSTNKPRDHVRSACNEWRPSMLLCNSFMSDRRETATTVSWQYGDQCCKRNAGRVPSRLVDTWPTVTTRAPAAGFAGVAYASCVVCSVFKRTSRLQIFRLVVLSSSSARCSRDSPSPCLGTASPRSCAYCAPLPNAWARPRLECHLLLLAQLQTLPLRPTTCSLVCQSLSPQLPRTLRYSPPSGASS